MAEYQRKSFPLFLRGMSIAVTPDRLPQGYVALLQNLRCVVMGEWRQRPGLTLIADVDSLAVDPITSIFSINDVSSSPARSSRFVTTSNGKLLTDTGATPGPGTYQTVATGFGTNPVTMVTARPDRSPTSFGFVSNDQKTLKISSAGAGTEWGLISPAKPVTTETSRLAYKIIDQCDSATGYSPTLTVTDRLGQSNTPVAITGILYDTASAQQPTPTGWASIIPDQTKFNEAIQPGMFINVTEGVTNESAVIDRVYPNITNTVIESIVYESGSTGICTIQLQATSPGLQVNTIVKLTTNDGVNPPFVEFVRVLSVTTGPTGIPSFKTKTDYNHTIGATVEGLKSFRLYLGSYFSTAAVLTSQYLKYTLPNPGTQAITKVLGAPLDLTTVSVGQQTSRPIQPDDLLHISLQVSDFSQITEIQIQFDCDSTQNDFTRNYFFKSIRPPDIQAAINQTASSLTAQQIAIQRQQLDAYTRQSLMDERARLEQELAMSSTSYGDYSNYDWRRDRLTAIDTELANSWTDPSQPDPFQPTPITTPGITGESQWSELKLTFGSFFRVGSDTSRGWRDIKAIRLSIKTISTISNLSIGFDSIWVGGTYGIVTNPITDQSSTSAANGINYVYRARNTVTGSRSNPSPPMRNLMYPERQSVTISIPTTSYPDSQADVFDIFRIGGTLGTYFYVGTAVKPAQGDAEFIDNIPDEIVVTQPLLEVDRFKPWVRPGAPVSGICNVVGTTLTATTGTLNTKWTRGTVILIDGKAYSFYAPPSSSTVVELNESAGSLIGVRYEIPEPLSEGLPLPVVFGPFGTGMTGEFIFGLGDPVNPGYLYWTNGNDPESCSDANILEVCSPSEPLINGTVLDGIIYVWSEKRSWRIQPSFSGGATGGGSMFYAQETAMGKGLAARYGLTTGDNLYFVSWDGIYASRGDAVESITDESLAPIFKRDGVVYDNASGPYLTPISFAPADLSKIRLTYTRDGLYFTYYDGTKYVNLYYSFFTKGWILDTYLQTGQWATVFHRQGGLGEDTLLVGSANGRIYSLDKTSGTDAGLPFDCKFVSGFEYFDDTRSIKQLGDMKLDLDLDGRIVTANWIYGPIGILSSPTSLTGAAGRQFYTIAPDTNTPEYVNSVGVQLAWTSTSPLKVPKIYEWQPAVLQKGYLSRTATDWIKPAGGRAFWLQGMYLTAIGQANIVVEIDDGEQVTTVALNNNTENTTAYTWTPVVCRQVRLRGVGANDIFSLIDVQFEGKSDSDLAKIWHTQATSLGMPGYSHIRDVIIAHESTSDLQFNLVIDGVTRGAYTIPHTDGIRSRSYFPVSAIKGKYFQFIITSTEPFRLFLADCEVRAKPWGVGATYQVFRPFGGATFDGGDGARL